MSIDQGICSEKLSHKCYIRIQSVYDTLKSAEKKAADYMLQYPELVADTTIVEISALAGCSEATLVRLARKLGFTGYPELKNAIVDDGAEETGALYKEISAEDSPLTVAHKVFETSMQSLADTQGLLDEEAYLKALVGLQEAEKIVLAGAGDAYSVAYAGYLKFSRIGMNVTCPQDFDLQLIEVSKFTEKDLLVVVSHSGRTQNLYDIAKYAKHREARVLAITNYPTSPIAKLADIVLLTASFIPSSFGEVITKRIPELCILETLYVNTVMQMGKEADALLRRSEKAILMNKI